ncbi:hypothetical protein BRADI_4g12011v3 [Brachypodium distachyon]|uniref:Uncharacterized protein n=1 Tax=Brachypodium distachyon TaxID=15368 RepID=A0A0Q3HGL0_BRADI|nr:hypothetical protein BRADI_4g12011v3 [Brachypodium distachyon]
MKLVCMTQIVKGNIKIMKRGKLTRGWVIGPRRGTLLHCARPPLISTWHAWHRGQRLSKTKKKNARDDRRSVARKRVVARCGTGVLATLGESFGAVACILADHGVAHDVHRECIAGSVTGRIAKLAVIVSALSPGGQSVHQLASVIEVALDEAQEEGRVLRSADRHSRQHGHRRLRRGGQEDDQHRADGRYLRRGEGSHCYQFLRGCDWTS